MSRSYVQCSWSEVPHLTEKAKEELLASIPEYQRNARSKGIPQLGSGAIYPISWSEIAIDPFEIPPWWRRAYGLDVGWNRTAAVWGAYDPDADILYLTNEYERSMAEPGVHAAAIRLRGSWIPGVIDPASRGRSQVDGVQLLQKYREMELDLTLANNAVEAGLFAVFQRMTTGRLKVFSSLRGFQREFNLYRRDEKGKVVKENDHLMDAGRYLVMSGIDRATIAPNAGEIYAKRHRPSPSALPNDYNPFAEPDRRF